MLLGVGSFPNPAASSSSRHRRRKWADWGARSRLVRSQGWRAGAISHQRSSTAYVARWHARGTRDDQVADWRSLAPVTMVLAECTHSQGYCSVVHYHHTCWVGPSAPAKLHTCIPSRFKACSKREPSLVTIDLVPLLACSRIVFASGIKDAAPGAAAGPGGVASTGDPAGHQHERAIGVGKRKRKGYF
jgi:hypothetical protein